MPPINTNRAKVAFAIGSTWGTAPDMTAGGAGKLTHVSQFAVNASIGRHNPRDNGFDNFIKEVIRLEESVSLTISMDLVSDNWWPLLAAHFMGTSSTPSEQTVSQGDYLHNIDFTNEIEGEFLSCSYLVEDDRAVEFPSIKITSMAIDMPVNQVGTVTFNAIADKVVVATGSQVNNATDIGTLSYPTQYEALVLGGTNHYFRMNAQGGGSLSSSNDYRIMRFGAQFARPVQAGHVLRGANTRYVVEPQQLGPTTGSINFQLYDIDDSVLDMLNDWDSASEFKAELFVDGTQIGSGVNRSLKLQLPRLHHTAPIPAGHDIPNANSLMQPTATLQTLQAASAPTGMTGVTNYMRAAIINNTNFDFN